MNHNHNPKESCGNCLCFSASHNVPNRGFCFVSPATGMDYNQIDARFWCSQWQPAYQDPAKPEAEKEAVEKSTTRGNPLEETEPAQTQTVPAVTGSLMPKSLARNAPPRRGIVEVTPETQPPQP